MGRRIKKPIPVMRKANNALAIRPPVLEGEVGTTEMHDLMARGYGLIEATMIIMHRRLQQEIWREFMYPPGVSGPVTDLDVS